MFLLHNQDNIPKSLPGTCEEAYTYVFEMCCNRTLDIVIYIVANATA